MHMQTDTQITCPRNVHTFFSETENLLTPYTHHPFLVRCAAQVNDRLIKENLMLLTVQTIILIQLEENYHLYE